MNRDIIPTGYSLPGVKRTPFLLVWDFVFIRGCWKTPAYQILRNINSRRQQFEKLWFKKVAISESIFQKFVRTGVLQQPQPKTDIDGPSITKLWHLAMPWGGCRPPHCMRTWNCAWKRVYCQAYDNWTRYYKDCPQIISFMTGHGFLL